MAEATQPKERPSYRTILLRLAALAAVMGLAGALTFGYLGWLHPAFDSFSHFRIHLSVGLILLALPLLILRFRIEALFAAALGTTAIVSTTGLPAMTGMTQVSASMPEAATPRAVYRLLQLNLRYDNANPERALSLIGRVKPDVVTLNEVSAMWAEKLALLEAAYPHRLICPPPAYIGGAAILSRRPFSQGFEPRCDDRGAFGRVKIDFSGRAVEVAALHLGWPWPFEQPWQLPHLSAPLGEIGDTAILAGDFNAAPWSETTRRVAADGGFRVLRGIGPTWLSYRLPEGLRGVIGLPIDQVLVKGGILPVSLETIEPAGSDHLPVLLEFTVLPEEEPAQVLQAAVANSE